MIHTTVDHRKHLTRVQKETSPPTGTVYKQCQKREEFQNSYFQGLRLSLSTVSLPISQLGTENVGQPYDQDIRETHKLVQEIAEDYRKYYNNLARPYNSPSNTIVRRTSEHFKRERRRPEIENANARFRSNVGSIQILLSVVQLCVNPSNLGSQCEHV